MKANLLLEDFQAALVRLEEALKLDSELDVFKAGCIQYFEFTFELAWKTIKATAEETGLDAGGSKRRLKPRTVKPGLSMRQSGWKCWKPETVCRIPTMPKMRSGSMKS